MQLPSDFKEFLRLLNQAKVEYLVIGGYAVGFHGHPRATKDIDVWTSADAANIKRLVDVLKEFGFDMPLLEQWKQNPIKTLRMGYPPARIEVLTVITGIEFKDAFPDRVSATLDGVPVSIIGLADLRANKRAAGRPQDLHDLENLPPA